MSRRKSKSDLCLYPGSMINGQYQLLEQKPNLDTKQAAALVGSLLTHTQDLAIRSSSRNKDCQVYHGATPTAQCGQRTFVPFLELHKLTCQKSALYSEYLNMFHLLNLSAFYFLSDT